MAALSLIKTRSPCANNPFVIPVLVFPNMDPNVAIGNLAGRKAVYPVWGTANLVVDLENIAKRRSVADRLAWDRIAGGVRPVTDGLIDLGVVNDTSGINPVGDESVSLSVAGFPGETRLGVCGTSDMFRTISPVKLLAPPFARSELAAITLAGSAVAILHASTNVAEAQAHAPEGPSQPGDYPLTGTELN